MLACIGFYFSFPHNGKLGRYSLCQSKCVEMDSRFTNTLPSLEAGCNNLGSGKLPVGDGLFARDVFIDTDPEECF